MTLRISKTSIQVMKAQGFNLMPCAASEPDSTERGPYSLGAAVDCVFGVLNYVCLKGARPIRLGHDVLYDASLRVGFRWGGGDFIVDLSSVSRNVAGFGCA